jgi:predicted ATPase
MLLRSIQFHNFRLFSDATLPLSRLTLLIGANGTGKSTALEALRVMAQSDDMQPLVRSMPLGMDVNQWSMNLNVTWDDGVGSTFNANSRNSGAFSSSDSDPAKRSERIAMLNSARVFSLIPEKLSATAPLKNTLDLKCDGEGLASVLTTMQDQFPERFDNLNQDLRKWLPEFDRILFETPKDGHRNVLLRTKTGGFSIRSASLSHGTLLSIAMLTLCHLPNPPAIIGLEEPDRGIHPRLLREVKDSLLRLTQPELFEEKRPPVQVIVTTHSPYLVDLFRDQLEDVVIVKKEGLWSQFVRLTDLPNVQEIVEDANLGEAWFSGILGGVPVTS